MIKKKVKNKKAFTLAETLVAVLIMLMVSSIMVTGIPAAKDAYEKVFVRSNAEIVMSTCIYALRSELSMAKSVNINDDGSEISYLSGDNGVGTKIDVDETKGIMVKRFSAENTEKQRLVSESASDEMILKYDSVNKPEGKDYITINNLAVYKNSGNTSTKILEREKLNITVL